ncbi:hypothetical protein DQW77_17705 [Roseovarius sp. TE539]|nr:hypothetical protein DQW77_17705 [Roseovarius sp. TE539]
MTCFGRALRAAGAAAILCVVAMPTTGQEVGVEALIADIDERAGQYAALVEILQGPDPARALAAFDVMLETGDKTMRETAISAAMTATDERLRARALWETLVRKDSITLVIETDGLDDEARGALDKWIGAVSTWGITARFPDTQCLNLWNSRSCEEDHNLSVSGLKIDMVYDGTIMGGLSLTSEGALTGHVKNVDDNAVYPATIHLR